MVFRSNELRNLSVKLEFVAFDNYQLKMSAERSIFPVPFIDRTSCFITKLLANADRVGIKPYKDVFDLVVMFGHWGKIPAKAYLEVYGHYGKKIIDQSLKEALTSFSDTPVEYADAAAYLSVDSTYYNRIILPNALKMLEHGCGFE